MSLPTDPTDRHRAIAGDFSTRTEAVTDWDAPAPVDGWTTRDVVRHRLVTDIVNAYDRWHAEQEDGRDHSNSADRSNGQRRGRA